MTTNLLRTSVSVGLSVVVAGLLSAPAQAATSCSGTSYAGTCYTTLASGETSSVVESIPISNTSDLDAVVSCAFSQTVTKTMTAVGPSGLPAPAPLRAGIFAGVQATVGLPLATSISQTGPQAAPGSAAFSLPSGRSVSCDRLYREVTATVEVRSHSGSASSKVGTYRTTIPSSLWVESR